ncbi:hypothetical protein PGT21_005663 [Puccinia graminis f. sp. tritici]|uniref:Uncharacterized protein n=1 Tax=Puccinia graminis f. sp. tritici TaxID=56615 RepID=A0A5B0NF90_PUCGR|nr:hypothetical protein PGT21_005663 [Puccinia graminis f. sp. tritici]
MIGLADIFGKKLEPRDRKPMVYEKLEKEYVLKSFSEKQVNWNKSGLSILWIVTVSNNISIDDKRPYKAILYEPDESTYNRLKYIWQNSPSTMIREENEIRKIVGEFEGTRRINAFRNQLYYHRIARNLWDFRPDQYTNRSVWNEMLNYINFHCFKRHLRLSYDPRDIGGPLLKKGKGNNMGLTNGDLSPFNDLALRSIYTDSERKKHLDLYSYLENASYPKNWWPLNFAEHCRLFGLDRLTVVKVGDALQLGSVDLASDGGQRTLSMDEAFSQILTVMTDRRSLLPWNESIERAWLHQYYGADYHRRLGKLSQFVILSPNEDLPLSIDTLKQITKRKKLIHNYHIGYELFWCEMGWDLTTYMQLMELRNSSKVKKYDELASSMSRFTQAELHALQFWHQSLCTVTRNQISVPRQMSWLEYVKEKLHAWSPRSLFTDPASTSKNGAS